MASKVQTVTSTQTPQTLTNEEILRYSRHLIMPEVGMDGQLKLKNGTSLIVNNSRHGRGFRI